MLRRILSIALGFSMAVFGGGNAGGEPLKRISFGVMGDVPYEPYEYDLLPMQIADLPDDFPFVVHVGDIKRGFIPCHELVYQRVAGILSKSEVPVFIIPGDNEYNDCPNPAQAWKHWSKHFLKFDDRWALGISVSRQPEREENFAFMKNQVLFVGVHILGGRVHDPAEWKDRHSDCARWFANNLQAQSGSVEAAVIFGHGTPTAKQADFFNAIAKTAAEFRKPVAYIHGDSHRFHRDQPFPEAPNFYRIQVDRGGIAPPIRVTVVPDAPQPFEVDRRLDRHPAGYPRNEEEAKKFRKSKGR